MLGGREGEERCIDGFEEGVMVESNEGEVREGRKG